MPDFLDQFRTIAHEVRGSMDEVDGMLEPTQGFRVLGKLTEEEISHYLEIATIELHLMGMYELLFRRHIERSAEKIISSPDVIQRAINFAGQIVMNTDERFFDNRVEADYYLSKVMEYQMLKQDFWFSVQKRLVAWTYDLEIRQGFSIVIVGDKFKE